jgi:cytochrome P450
VASQREIANSLFPSCLPPKFPRGHGNCTLRRINGGVFNVTNLFSDESRRNPFPIYAQLREQAPVFRDPATGLWMILDYDGVKAALGDPAKFSSRYGPDWLVFADPPRHTKLRALIAKAFTPRSVANLEPRIRELSRQLLDPIVERGVTDLAADYAIPLPMLVIAEMLGIPPKDRPRFQRWSDVMLDMSHTIAGTGEASDAANAFIAATGEMNDYLTVLLRQRRAAPKDDLLTRLLEGEVDGERLSQAEILGFFQLLLLAGQETTTNLIDNAMLCLIEHPEQLARLRAAPELLPSAIEEVLRFRSPLQWFYRIPRRDVEAHGQTIPAGKLVLVMVGSANRDPRQFADPDRFDIRRDPNTHLPFGQGIHFCLGAPLARLEARIAIGDLLARFQSFGFASAEPWPPRRGLNVHGPARLPLRFTAA